MECVTNKEGGGRKGKPILQANTDKLWYQYFRNNAYFFFQKDTVSLWKEIAKFMENTDLYFLRSRKNLFCTHQ